MGNPFPFPVMLHPHQVFRWNRFYVIKEWMEILFFSFLEAISGSSRQLFGPETDRRASPRFSLFYSATGALYDEACRGRLSLEKIDFSFFLFLSGSVKESAEKNLNGIDGPTQCLSLSLCHAKCHLIVA